VDAGNPPKFGVPRTLMLTKTRQNPFHLYRNHDVAPGGQRFLIYTLSDDSPRPAIEVVLNWQSALKR